MLACPAEAEAGGCRTIVSVPYVAPVVHTPYVAPVYVAPIVAEVAVFKVYSTLIPSYGATFVPQALYTPPALNAASPCEQKLDALQKRLDALERGQGPLRQPLQTAPMPKAQDPQAANGVIGQSCLQCHASSVAAKDGGAFAMDRPLTDKEKLLVFRKAFRGEMPPANNKKNVPPLRDEDFARLESELK